jgi:Holliday junction resolvase-like predicted endonuclease
MVVLFLVFLTASHGLRKWYRLIQSPNGEIDLIQKEVGT